MMVLHLNKTDLQGGAARAAYRLHLGLKSISVDSKMLVDDKISDDPSVHGLVGKINKIWHRALPFINEIPLKFYNWEGTPFYTGCVGRNIARDELLKLTDVINLHWVSAGFLSIRNISRLAKLGKPIVWTLHDMWAFTGGCHYSGECERYVNFCGSCPQLNSDKDDDITRRIWARKERAYKGLNLTIVTPSKWLAECVKKSSLLSDVRVEVVPYGLNINIFKPINKSTARNIFNLPENKKIILFGAIRSTSDKRKGFSFLHKAVNYLNEIITNPKDYYLLVFGASHPENNEPFPFEVNYAGSFSDDASLALLYSCADVFIAPSLEDNLPNTVIESLACGTPVVAFNVGGMPDMIDHRKNGYLAKYKDVEDLSRGINWILDNEKHRQKLAEAAHDKAIREYLLEVQARRYVELYEELL